jgi:hypothetical protein
MESSELLVLVVLPIVVGILVAFATRLSTARFWTVVALGAGTVLVVAGAFLLRSRPAEPDNQSMAVLGVFYFFPLIVAALAGRLSLALTSRLSDAAKLSVAAVTATLAYLVGIGAGLSIAVSSGILQP